MAAREGCELPSPLPLLLPNQPAASGDVATLTEMADAALAESASKLITPIAAAFNELSDPEKQDFLERILILDGSPRIGDIPALIGDNPPIAAATYFFPNQHVTEVLSIDGDSPRRT